MSGSGLFLTRRRLLKQGLQLAALGLMPASVLAQFNKPLLTRAIPSSGQKIPLIGMGSYITFNVGNDTQARLDRVEVLRKFFELGGQLIDSSPMYGSSEAVLGFCLEHLGETAAPLFSATKVWTRGKESGLRQVEDSQSLWKVPRLNLNQVHNLLDWQIHLQTLFQMKNEGQLQYVGITTSHGRRHDDVEKIIKTQPIDFVQLTYNIENRTVENRLLPLALEKGVAVIANRPFMKGRLFDRYQQYPLPEWCREFDCGNWAQFFLKFVVSHPAISCAIPATSQVEHMQQNMGACYGRLPDEGQRAHMIRYLQAL